VVHWQARRLPPAEVLWQLVCLNDRFALDGLSPPSYAGLLWCFGWGDKPASGQKVSEKWASQYRTGAHGFEQAKVHLLNNRGLDAEPASYGSPASKKARSNYRIKSPVQSTTILSFFSPAGNEKAKGAPKMIG